jgi:tetratricopeptide (TPR) repeat protein
MKKMVHLGLSLFLILALAIPSVAQQPQAKSKAEYDAYIAFYNETNPAKKAELGEIFLTDHKDSAFVPDSFTLLIRAYTQAQNWPKVMEVAERFTTAIPNADATKKVFMYSNAMAAAQQANNFEKIIEYGDKVLGVAPNDLNAQITLSTMIPERLPQNDAGKNAALTKAFDLAGKALTQVQQIFSQPKPANFTDAQWSAQKADIEGQLHSTLGFVHLNRAEYEKAGEEYDTALKSTPKDAVSRFRLGLAYQYRASDASKQLVAAVETENAAKLARADQAVLDELIAKREAIENDVRAKRDRSIDELATAVAIGGVVTQPARDQLERLYKSKNSDSLEGLDQLIAEKKAQLQ